MAELSKAHAQLIMRSSQPMAPALGHLVASSGHHRHLHTGGLHSHIYTQHTH